MVEFLISNMADVNTCDTDGNTVLHYAIEHKDVVNLLIKHEARIDIKNKGGATPLYLAAEYGYKDTARILVSQGAHGNLQVAALLDDEKMAISLVNSGADINQRYKDGETPLHIAAKYGSAKVASCLISKNACLDAKDESGNTPLNSAILDNQWSIARLLISSGANVNVSDDNGDTPLHFAVSSGGDLATVELLLKHGAKIDVKDKDGKTPLDWAREEKNTKTIQILARPSGGK
jgi:ankyrin repeat protein